jgi:hypothetical protein
VDDDSEIIIDIVNCFSNELDNWTDQGNAIGNFLRYKEIKDYYTQIGDIYKFKLAFPDINFRYYIEPSTTLPGGLAILNFNNETNTFPIQMQGRLDGENAVKQGEGYMFDKMEEYRESLDLQNKYETVGHFMRYTVKESAKRFRRERRKQTMTQELEFLY